MAQSKSIAQGIDITEFKQAKKALLREKHFSDTVMNSSPGLLFVFDDKGNIIQWNRNAEKVTGYSAKEIAKMNILDFVANEDQKTAAEAMQEVLTKGQSSLEIKILSKAGKKTPFYITGLRTKFENTTRVVCTGIDITERKQVEEKLRQSEERYHTILETIEDGYYELDLNGNFTFVNNATCGHLGYTKEELIGMNNRAYTSPETAKKIYEIFSAIYKKGKSTNVFDYEAIRKDGTTITLELSVSLISNAEGKSIGFRGISRDITKRKQAQEALRESEEKYRTILETMQEGYYELDLVGHFTFVNDALCKHLGYSKEELIGTDPQQIQNETTAEKIDQVYREIYRTGKPINALESEYVRKDGTKGMYELSASLIRDAQGKPIGFRGISRDVTERKQMEEALRQSEERYRGILENMQEAYYETDLGVHITFVNDALCRHLGYTKEELIGMHYRQLQDERTLKKMYPVYNEVYRTGVSLKAVESEYIRKDGTKGTYELSVSLFRDAQGKPIGFRGVSRDVTERKKAEEQLKRYAAELERSNEEVKNFAYIVSHDLRVPLVNLKGYTSELRSALEVIGANFDAALPHLNDEKRSEVAMALHEDVPEALEFITNSVSRMDSFINAVLILSRLGRQDLKPEPLDMNALVRTIVETMSHQLQERGIEVIVGSLPQVVADRTSMEQITGNILSNAVKYLDSSRPGRIEVSAQGNGAETTFRIRDNGRGIAQEDMHKVFAPFRRAGKQDTQGEGMGLAYVQTLLRRHGGRISCESELGKGTTFSFTISTRSEKGARDA